MSPRLTLGMLLGQMMIVKSPVPPPRQLHNAPLNLLLDLMSRRPTPVAVHYSLGSSLHYPRLDPITLPLANPSHHRCLYHRRLASKHSFHNLSCVSSFIVRLSIPPP